MGNNLQDHVWTDAVTYYLERNAAITEERARSLWSLMDYFVFGQGVAIKSKTMQKGLVFILVMVHKVEMLY